MKKRNISATCSGMPRGSFSQGKWVASPRPLFLSFACLILSFLLLCRRDRRMGRRGAEGEEARRERERGRKMREGKEAREEEEKEGGKEGGRVGGREVLQRMTMYRNCESNA